MTTVDINLFAPFYAAKLGFKSTNASLPSTAYDCVVCCKTLDVGTDAAISYNLTRFGTWAHTECVTTSGLSVNTDRTAKEKAKRAAHAVYAASKTQTPPATPPATEPTVHIDIFRQQIRDEIETEYEDLMSRAIAKIERLQAQIAALQAHVCVTGADVTNEPTLNDVAQNGTLVKRPNEPAKRKTPAQCAKNGCHTFVKRDTSHCAKHTPEQNAERKAARRAALSNVA